MGTGRPRAEPNVYSTLIKKLVLPDGVVATALLVYDDIEARAITRDHLSDDVRGINASLDLIRRTRGGGWREAVTEEIQLRQGTSSGATEFRDECVIHLRRLRAGRLPGLLLILMGRRTELTEELMHYDVDVSWWVTPDGYERGFYEKLHAGLQQWLAAEFPFWRAYYSNSEIPE